MSDTDPFGRYVEALNALTVVEGRQREALRTAVESSAASQQQAREQMADQQRMYDRAGQEVIRAEGLLGELRVMVDLPQRASTAPAPQAGTPLQLVEVRARVRQVLAWAEETKPIIESLLRTKARLAVAPEPEPRPAPTAMAPDRRLPVGVVIGVVAIVALVVLVIVVLTGT